MKKKTGSFTGFAAVAAIGFAFYFILRLTSGLSSVLTYEYVIEGIGKHFPKQVLWFVMNFTEPQFFASVMAGIFLIIGGFAAWFLAVKNSKYAGIDICYGSASLFPWVLASQVLSAGLAIFVYRYIDLFEMTESTWAATFITIVGAPPSIMLIYGPSIQALLVSSAFAGLLSAPLATWLSIYVVTPLQVPGVVANVLTMAIVGVLTCTLCKVLPWVEKKPVKPHRKEEKPEENVYSAGWLIRRCLADFTEAQFYGNEVAAIFLLLGVLIDWFLMSGVPVYGGAKDVLPAILLSQFISAATGVFLYACKYEKNGWYATYVPVVSVGPACVLMFGGTIPVALVAGILGGIIGAPFAEYFSHFLPEDVAGTNANVMSMAMSTILVYAVMKFLGF